MGSPAEWLYHYYEKSRGPFVNLSDLSETQAEEVQESLRKQNDVMASRRDKGYVLRRRELEEHARELFISKGGRPVRKAPHYMVVGTCPWLMNWYKESACVQIHISRFEPDTLSFSYGDLFPTFSPRVNDGKEYRRQIYTYPEILELINKYGLPQDWNSDGSLGPERYIEVQVWDDEPLQRMFGGDNRDVPDFTENCSADFRKGLQ